MGTCVASQSARRIAGAVGRRSSSLGRGVPCLRRARCVANAGSSCSCDERPNRGRSAHSNVGYDDARSATRPCGCPSICRGRRRCGAAGTVSHSGGSLREADLRADKPATPGFEMAMSRLLSERADTALSLAMRSLAHYRWLMRGSPAVGLAVSFTSPRTRLAPIRTDGLCEILCSRRRNLEAGRCRRGLRIERVARRDGEPTSRDPRVRHRRPMGRRGAARDTHVGQPDQGLEGRSQH